MDIQPREMEFLVKEIESWTGIFLNDAKDFFLDSRLRPLLVHWNEEDINSFVNRLKDNPNRELITSVIEAIVTHETSFMRDIKAFNVIKEDVIPKLAENRQENQPVRVWCAACSTGQEAYSIAMLLQENAAFKNIPCEILATDISKNGLEKAKKGVYSQFEVQRGLPIQLLVKYFNQVEESWHVGQSTQSMIRFEERNLMQPFEDLPRFDLILCRNVLIYFREETRVEVLKRMLRHLQPEGVLCLGATEQMMAQMTETLELEKGNCAMYKKQQKGD